MKVLRSQELYSDVLYERSKQVVEKERIKEARKEKEWAYHEDLMAQIQEAEEREQRILETKKLHIMDISKTREEQLLEVRAKREEEKRELQAIGEAIAKETENRLREEKEAQKELQLKIKQSSIDMLEANARLKVVKEQMHAKELEDNARREAEILQIEQRNNAHKALEKRRFEKAQIKRQQIIDAAVQSLTERKKNEQARLEKQEEEVNEKNEREDKNKSDKREKLWQEVVASRSEQMEQKRRQDEKEKQDQERMFALMKEQVALEELKEKQKELQALETVKTIKAIQLNEAIEHQRRKVEERLLEIEQANILKEIAEQDDKKFAEVAKREIERYRADGKPVYTLYRALEHQPPDLIAAQRNKVKKENKDA